MVTRGFDPYLIARVERAHGDHHYFDVDALRFFDSYGGASSGLPRVMDPEGLFTAILESVRAADGTRHYRPTVVMFTKDIHRGGEMVEVFHPYDVDIHSAPTSRGVALRRIVNYVIEVRGMARQGSGIHDAAHAVRAEVGVDR